MQVPKHVIDAASGGCTLPVRIAPQEFLEGSTYRSCAATRCRIKHMRGLLGSCGSTICRTPSGWSAATTAAVQPPDAAASTT
jgi:hypothetical protein